MNLQMSEYQMLDRQKIFEGNDGNPKFYYS